jgi:hypothetical protein
VRQLRIMKRLAFELVWDIKPDRIGDNDYADLLRASELLKELGEFE